MSLPPQARQSATDLHYINPLDAHITAQAVKLVAPVTTFYILALGSLALRFWARRIKRVSLGFSDYACIVAALFGTGYFAICWLVVERGGVGYPITVVPPEAQTFTQKAFVVAWLLQTWANSFVRLSILDFLVTIFSVPRFRVAAYVLEGCTVAYLLACTIVWFTICRPLRYNWVLSPEAEQHCGDINLKFLLSAIFNLVLDTCILVLPMPMLWRLQLSFRKKISLTVVFGVGVFVCFATAWRTYQVVAFSSVEAKLNFTITIVEDALWSGLEITLGIINACLPVTPPAFQKIVKTPLLATFVSSLRSTAATGTKPSGFASSTSNTDKGASRPSWMRLAGDSGGGGGRGTKEYETSDILLQTEFSVDVESQTSHPRHGDESALDPWSKADKSGATDPAWDSGYGRQNPTTTTHPAPIYAQMTTEHDWPLSSSSSSHVTAVEEQQH